jgi:hypothetical protein
MALSAAYDDVPNHFGSTPTGGERQVLYRQPAAGFKGRLPYLFILLFAWIGGLSRPASNGVGLAEGIPVLRE